MNRTQTILGSLLLVQIVLILVVRSPFSDASRGTASRPYLPVLEAAHIRPYAHGGEHRVDNGLLLRSDLHTLFDRGYVTVTPLSCDETDERIRDTLGKSLCDGQ